MEEVEGSSTSGKNRENLPEAEHLQQIVKDFKLRLKRERDIGNLSDELLKKMWEKDLCQKICKELHIKNFGDFRLFALGRKSLGDIYFMQERWERKPEESALQWAIDNGAAHEDIIHAYSLLAKGDEYDAKKCYTDFAIRYLTQSPEGIRILDNSKIQKDLYFFCFLAKTNVDVPWVQNNLREKALAWDFDRDLEKILQSYSLPKEHMEPILREYLERQSQARKNTEAFASILQSTLRTLQKPGVRCEVHTNFTTSTAGEFIVHLEKEGFMMDFPCAFSLSSDDQTRAINGGKYFDISYKKDPDGSKKAIQSIVSEYENNWRIAWEEKEKMRRGFFEIGNNEVSVRFVDLENFYPQTSENIIPVRQGNLARYIDKDEMRHQRDSKNLENTNMEELQKWLRGHLESKPEILANLGIKSDIRHLSPRNAILLASHIVMSQLEYSYELAAIDNPLPGYYRIDDHYMKSLSEERQKEIRANPRKVFDEVRHIDANAVETLLSIDKKGVCRNYAEVEKAVFDAMRSMQDSKSNLLKNLHCKTTTSRIFQQRDGVERKKGHAYNTFFSVSDNGNLLGVIVDTTWADTPALDGMKGDETAEELDFGRQRFVSELDKFIAMGIFKREDVIGKLEMSMNTSTDHFDRRERKDLAKYLGDFYLGKGDEEKGLSWYLAEPDAERIVGLMNRNLITKKVLKSSLRNYVENESNKRQPEYDTMAMEYHFMQGSLQNAANHAARIVGGRASIMMQYCSLMGIEESPRAFHIPLQEIFEKESTLKKAYPDLVPAIDRIKKIAKMRNMLQNE